MTDASRRLADGGIAALAAMRIAAGVLAWLNPRLIARLFGMPDSGRPSHYAWRLFAVRDAVLGVATLGSSGGQRRAFATAGLACDVADGAAGAISVYRNDFTRSTAGAPVLVPAIAVAFGAWALRGAGR
ncbi:hypothetical protein A5662_01050 [Mycobacteriaceae bacterium 1482268.1]|nr:hypothetical protein A5662_01050 [Mycobacteriaceae bacterium 1482268.1]